jgi:iron(III) transport system permease protein
VVIVAVVTVAMLALDALGKYLPEGTLPWHCETDATAAAKVTRRVHAGIEKAERFEPAPALGT